MERFKQYKPPTTKLPFEINKKYHVFLSFRGPDVRKTLVDHLYEALSAAGLNVFIDSEKLEKGEKISPTLEKAIKSSAICIPIFSKGYADSPWCLMEAAEMLNTHGLIIPLFYHVEPSHVRHPESGSSPFKQSFLKHNFHSNRYPRGEIGRWKKALQQICSRSGWSTDITQGKEKLQVEQALQICLSEYSEEKKLHQDKIWNILVYTCLQKIEEDVVCVETVKKQILSRPKDQVICIWHEILDCLSTLMPWMQ